MYCNWGEIITFWGEIIIFRGRYPNWGQGFIGVKLSLYIGTFNWGQDYYLLVAYYQLLGRDHYLYESFSDVGEIRVYFASKILTPCRMH